jgi:hypothetical protein
VSRWQWYVSAIVFVIVVLIGTYHGWQPWLAVHTGSAGGQEATGYYAYWSGVGSVFPWSMGLLGTLAALTYHSWRHKNCHSPGCWRIGHYEVAGGQYQVCAKHHPDHHVRNKTLTLDHIHTAHALHLLRQYKQAPNLEDRDN